MDINPEPATTTGTSADAAMAGLIRDLTAAGYTTALAGSDLAGDWTWTLTVTPPPDEPDGGVPALVRS
jgi:hypothetical protein